MSAKVHQAEYGRHLIAFELEYRSRSTLEISVQPDGVVRVVAPVMAALDEIEARIRKRGRWILAQQRYFEQFTPRTPARKYVPGETHLYLGRQYRLKVLPGQDRGVRMVHGFIEVSGVDFDDHAGIQKAVGVWYTHRARIYFLQRMELCRLKFPEPDQHQASALRLQRMAARWGSMTPGGKLILNPDLIRAPVDAVEYVIIHELCHLAVPNHSKAFFELQSLVMPDWERRKLRLERAMA